MRPWPAQTRTTPEHPDTRLQEGQYESSVAMPSGRSRPSAFGINTRRTGFARYFPDCTRPCRSGRFSLRSCSYSRHVTPSAPGAAS